MAQFRINARRALVGACAGMAALTVSVSGQSPSDPTDTRPRMTENWTTPRTAWGDPDLQGMYTTDALGQNVPLERDPKLGTKAWLTQEEADKRRAERRLAIAFGAPGDTGNYGTEWRDTERARPSNQSSLLIDPPNGRLPPLTPEGQKRQAARPDPNQRPNGPEDFSDPWDRCITRGMPGVMMPNGYANGLQIIQVPGSVVLFYEMIHEVRRVPLDGRPHAHKKIRQWWGDPRGRWEGDTLVVETTNFNSKNTFYGSSENMRLVERFTRTGPDTIDYRYTVEDPTIWTRPFTALVPLQADRSPNAYELWEYACHEGNYALANMLSAARAEERAEAEAGKKGQKK
jgi:hypothetical protein